jgi:hypothetical protein
MIEKIRVWLCQKLGCTTPIVVAVPAPIAVVPVEVPPAPPVV